MLTLAIGSSGGICASNSGCVAHAVVCDRNGPYLQRVGINAQVYFALLPPVFGTVLLAFPFAFAQEFYAGAVHQQIQRCAATPVRQLHLQCSLAAAEGAEVGHSPIHARQMQQALNQSQPLAQRQAKQTLDISGKTGYLHRRTSACDPARHSQGRTTACLGPARSSATLGP